MGSQMKETNQSIKRGKEKYDLVFSLLHFPLLYFWGEFLLL